MDIFQRNILLWGKENQKVLENSSVTIFGLGGLGCSILQILVRSGVKNFYLYDKGKINPSDIGRQTLYALNDIGKSKTKTTSSKLMEINPECQITCIDLDINFLTDIYPSDCYIDCVDGYETKRKIQNLVGIQNFLVHGGVEKKYGQICTFGEENDSIGLKELYNSQNEKNVSRAICPQAVQFIGSLMADEVINVIWGKPKLLNKILFADLENYELKIVNLTNA